MKPPHSLEQENKTPLSATTSKNTSPASTLSTPLLQKFTLALIDCRQKMDNFQADIVKNKYLDKKDHTDQERVYTEKKVDTALIDLYGLVTEISDNVPALEELISFLFDLSCQLLNAKMVNSPYFASCLDYLENILKAVLKLCPINELYAILECLNTLSLQLIKQETPLNQPTFSLPRIAFSKTREKIDRLYDLYLFALSSKQINKPNQTANSNFEQKRVSNRKSFDLEPILYNISLPSAQIVIAESRKSEVVQMKRKEPKKSDIDFTEGFTTFPSTIFHFMNFFLLEENMLYQTIDKEIDRLVKLAEEIKDPSLRKNKVKYLLNEFCLRAWQADYYYLKGKFTESRKTWAKLISRVDLYSVICLKGSEDKELSYNILTTLRMNHLTKLKLLDYFEGLTTSLQCHPEGLTSTPFAITEELPALLPTALATNLAAQELKKPILEKKGSEIQEQSQSFNSVNKNNKTTENNKKTGFENPPIYKPAPELKKKNKRRKQEETNKPRKTVSNEEDTKNSPASKSVKEPLKPTIPEVLPSLATSTPASPVILKPDPRRVAVAQVRPKRKVKEYTAETTANDSVTIDASSKDKKTTPSMPKFKTKIAATNQPKIPTEKNYPRNQKAADVTISSNPPVKNPLPLAAESKRKWGNYPPIPTQRSSTTPSSVPARPNMNRLTKLQPFIPSQTTTSLPPSRNQLNTQPKQVQSENSASLKNNERIKGKSKIQPEDDKLKELPTNSNKNSMTDSASASASASALESSAVQQSLSVVPEMSTIEGPLVTFAPGLQHRLNEFSTTSRHLPLTQPSVLPPTITLNEESAPEPNNHEAKLAQTENLQINQEKKQAPDQGNQSLKEQISEIMLICLTLANRVTQLEQRNSNLEHELKNLSQRGVSVPLREVEPATPITTHALPPTPTIPLTSEQQDEKLPPVAANQEEHKTHSDADSTPPSLNLETKATENTETKIDDQYFFKQCEDIKKKSSFEIKKPASAVYETLKPSQAMSGTEPNRFHGLCLSLKIKKQKTIVVKNELSFANHKLDTPKQIQHLALALSLKVLQAPKIVFHSRHTDKQFLSTLAKTLKKSDAKNYLNSIVEIDLTGGNLTADETDNVENILLLLSNNPMLVILRVDYSFHDTLKKYPQQSERISNQLATNINNFINLVKHLIQAQNHNELEMIFHNQELVNILTPHFQRLETEAKTASNQSFLQLLKRYSAEKQEPSFRQTGKVQFFGAASAQSVDKPVTPPSNQLGSTVPVASATVKPPPGFEKHFK